MLTFKPFTTLLNITLINLHYALRQARYVDVDVEPYAVNCLCLSMRNVRDYYPPKDCRYTMVVLWGSVVPHIAHASFCDTVDCCRLLSTAKPRAHASQRQICFQSWRKATKASFFENMTIYLKTKKMSQWTKHMRWRIKKSIPSFVLKGTYVV